MGEWHLLFYVIVGTMSLVVKGKSFADIKQDLLSRNALFEDPDFPATNSSVFFTPNQKHNIVWKRPGELSKNPQFIVNGISRFDAKQGKLGDCWFIAATSTLTLQPELFKRVVPDNQTFQKDDYAGIFRFNFWQYGEWVEVIVDDRLPTSHNKLAYARSSTVDEFWEPLLEKAYAKLNGNYEALDGGSQIESLEDFSGGIGEKIELQGKTPNNLFDIMLKSFARSSLIGGATPTSDTNNELIKNNGIVKKHAFSITDVKMITLGTKNIPLVRCRNPWGNATEWNGAWSDKSTEWQSISEEDKKALGLTFDSEGEFWMTFEDFVKNFKALEIVHLGPQSMAREEVKNPEKIRWEMILEKGSWKKNVSAGGCKNYSDTFWTNPQFRIKLVDADKDDADNQTTIIVGLMQKNARRKKKDGLEKDNIGYNIYKCNNQPAGPLNAQFFKNNAAVVTSPFKKTREVAGRHKLAPGDYCIIPSTFYPNEEGEFILRIFSEKSISKK